MAQIMFFEITGLAGRRKTVRHVMQPDVNVFWGSNGCGKTSMLKVLHSALVNDATSLLRVPFTRASVGIRLTGTREPREITRTIKRSDISDKELNLPAEIDDEETERFLRHRAATGQVIRWETLPEALPPHLASIRHGYLPISRVSEARRGRFRQSRPVTELIDETSFDRLFAHQIRELWLDYNQRALIEIREAQERGLARILSSVLQARDRSISAPPVEDEEEAYQIVNDFFKGQRVGAMLRLSKESFIRNYAHDSLVQEVVTEVADVQRGIDRAQEPQHRIESLLGRMYGGRKKVELRGREVVILSGTKPIPLESLSSGEKQLLQLLLECLAAGESPVLIDEPELSLHVDWQNQLVACMETVNETAQLIMATHAPEVMANLEDRMIKEL